jgi:ELWxxDGT repeat protein
VRIKDIFTGSSSATPSWLTVYNGVLYFSANAAGSGNELWRTDGTALGTMMVRDINPGATSSVPRNLTVIGSNVILVEASDVGTNSNELWRTDGTAAGTVLVKRINALNAGSNPQRFFTVDGRLFFQAEQSGSGAELWTSDGTAGGTLRVTDINPGNSGSFPIPMGLVNGWYIFQARDDARGAELWRAATGFAWSASDGTLVVTGTDAADTFALAANATDITVTLSGGLSQSVPLASVTSIIISGLGADDVLEVNSALAGKPLTFNGNGGHDRLNLNSGAHTFAGNIAAGSAALDLHVAAGATATFAASQTFSDLSIDGSAALTAGGAKVLVLDGALAIGASGSLLLADNDMIVRYSGASPIGTASGGIYSGITGQIQSGRNDGTWDGHGIVTNMPAATAGLTTLAPAEAADVFGLSGSETALWNGVTVDATTVLVKYTYAGDANLDGVINGGDYGIIDNFVQVPGASGCFNGDFNFDGVIDGGDYGVIDNNIQAQGIPL